jgi:Tfp pilus assembly protein PilF
MGEKEMNKKNAAIEFIENNPNKVYDADVISTAMTELYLNHPEISLMLIQKALEKNPEDIILLKWEGITWEKLGKNVWAIDAYRKAVEIAGKSDNLYDSFIQEIYLRIKKLGY